MGATDFTTYQVGTDLQATFRAARDEARRENGHREGYSGDIQTKERVVLRRRDPLTRAEADTFIYGPPDQDGDREHATRDGACFAVPIRADSGAATIGFLFYGVAPL
jgi:hypothetical protein